MKRKILFILFCICSFSSMVASKRTGAQDRELWVKYLCRIASPVIDNLAKGTLEANMPCTYYFSNINCCFLNCIICFDKFQY